MTAGVTKLESFDKSLPVKFRAVDVDVKRWKYNEVMIHNLQAWMCNNRYTHKSPNMNNNINERTIWSTYTLLLLLFNIIVNCILTLVLLHVNKDNLIRLENNASGQLIYQRRRKRLIEIKPEAVHVLVCKPVEDGEYAGTCDPKGPVQFSVIAPRTYLLAELA